MTMKLTSPCISITPGRYIMPNFDRVSIGRKNTPEGENVVFIKGTEVLTSVPTAVIREAANAITRFEVCGDPKVSISFSVANGFEMSVYKWWKQPTQVSLSEYGDTTPLRVWDIIEIDPF